MYPPYKFLCKVADTYPSAISTYMMLWRDKYESGSTELTYTWQLVQQERFFQWSRFKQDLATLDRALLLRYYKIKDDVIEVILFEEEYVANEGIS